MSSPQHRGAWAGSSLLVPASPWATASTARVTVMSQCNDTYVTVAGPYKRGCATGPAPEVPRRSGRMSSKMADASKEQAARTRRTALDCWESSAMEHVPAIRGVTDQGASTPSTTGARLTPVWGFLWGGPGSVVNSGGGSAFGDGDVTAFFLCHQNAGVGVLEGWQPPEAARDLIFFAFQSDHLSGMQCQPTSGSTSSSARWVGPYVALVPHPKSRKLTPKGPTKRPIGIAQVRCCFW